MKLFKFLFLIPLFSLFCCSGGPAAMYHSYHHVTSPWSRNDTLLFQVSIPDSSEQYQTFILIRNIASYPYQNLAIRIEHDLRDSISWNADTLHCDLTAKKNNKWDISEWGGLRQSKIPLGDSILPLLRTSHFKVTHLMENDSISGINDIGIMMER